MNKNRKFFIIFFVLNIYIIFQHRKLPSIIKKKNDKYFYDVSQSENYILKEKIDLSKEENRTSALIKGKKFVDKCFNEQSMLKNYKIKVKPIISVIIPLYNCQSTVFAAINSIRNQNLTDFEIILIDDFSNDNTSYITKFIQERDSRIKILKNMKNMGSLYSRSIGVLSSRGDYIFGLDNDDLFFMEDIFDYIIRVAIQFKYDIVGFRSVSIHNYKDNINKMKDLYNYQYYLKNLVIYQPQLSTWILNRDGKFLPHDLTIWAKCIKSKIYKDAIILLGVKRYSFFVSWAEDSIANYIIFNIAQSFRFIHKYGIIHLINRTTASFTKPVQCKLFGDILFLDIIYDFSKYNYDKNYAALGAIYYKRIYGITKFNNNNTNLIYLKSILAKMVNSQYISTENKMRLRKEFITFII